MNSTDERVPKTENSTESNVPNKNDTTGRITVTEKFKCKKCGDEHSYKSTEIVYDHLVCKTCGNHLKIVKYVDQINTDYVSLAGIVHRRTPKVHMTKKQRRRAKNEIIH